MQVNKFIYLNEVSLKLYLKIVDQQASIARLPSSTQKYRARCVAIRYSVNRKFKQKRVQRKECRERDADKEGEPGAKKIPHAIPLQTTKEFFITMGDLPCERTQHGKGLYVQNRYMISYQIRKLTPVTIHTYQNLQVDRIKQRPSTSTATHASFIPARCEVVDRDPRLRFFKQVTRKGMKRHVRDRTR